MVILDFHKMEPLMGKDLISGNLPCCRMEGSIGSFSLVALTSSSPADVSSAQPELFTALKFLKIEFIVFKFNCTQVLRTPSEWSRIADPNTPWVAPRSVRGRVLPTTPPVQSMVEFFSPLASHEPAVHGLHFSQNSCPPSPHQQSPSVSPSNTLWYLQDKVPNFSVL